MSTLPALSTLSPPEEASKHHPPLHLSLNSHIIDELRQRAQAFVAGKAPRPELKLSLFDGSASVHLDGLIFAGSQIKEADHVEVFVSTKKSSDTFRSCGRISDHVVLKPEKPVKQVEPPKIDASHPAHRKVLHLLAAKPQSIAGLVAKIGEPETVISAILAQVAVHHKKRNVFELKEEFRPAKKASRAPSAELKSHLVSPDSSDHLTPDNSAPHAPRFAKNLSHSPPPHSRPTSPYQSLSPPLSEEHSRHNDETSTSDRTRKRKIAPTHTLDAADARLAAKPRNPQPADPKRARVATPARSEDADMFELAQKFRDRYGEYRELYSALQDRQSRPPKQLQKLMTMHRQLAGWKEKLWSSRSKQVN